MRTLTARLVVVLAVPALVAGCSMFGDMFEGKKVDYKSAGKLPTLEVPPDLTRPGRDERYAMPDTNPSGTATFSQYNAERQGVRSTAHERRAADGGEHARRARRQSSLPGRSSASSRTSSGRSCASSGRRTASC